MTKSKHHPKSPKRTAKGKTRVERQQRSVAATETAAVGNKLKRQVHQDVEDDALARKRRYLESYKAEPTPFPERIPVKIKNEPGIRSPDGADAGNAPQHGRVSSLVDSSGRAAAVQRPFVQDIWNSDLVHRRHFEGAMEHVNMQFDPRYAESNAMSQLGNWLDLHEAQIEAGHPGLVENILRPSLDGRFGAMCDFFTRLRDDVANATGRELAVLDFPTLRMARLQMGITDVRLDSATQRVPLTPSQPTVSPPKIATGSKIETAADEPVPSSEPRTDPVSPAIEDDANAGVSSTDSADQPSDQISGDGNLKHVEDGGNEYRQQEPDTASHNRSDALTASTTSGKKARASSKAKSSKRDSKSSMTVSAAVETTKVLAFEFPVDLFVHAARACMELAGLDPPADRMARKVFKGLASDERYAWTALWQNLRNGNGRLDQGQDIFGQQNLLERLDERPVVQDAAETQKGKRAAVSTPKPAQSRSLLTRSSSSKAFRPAKPLPAFPTFLRASLSSPTTQLSLVAYIRRPDEIKDDRFLAIIINTPFAPILHPTADEMQRACVRTFGAHELQSVTRHDDNTWLALFDSTEPVHRACEARAQIRLAGRSVEVEYHSLWPPRAFVADITEARIRAGAIEESVSRAFRKSKGRPELWLLEKDGRKQLLMKFPGGIGPWESAVGVQRWHIPIQAVGGDVDGKVYVAEFKPRTNKDSCLMCGVGHRSGTLDCGRGLRMVLE